MIFFSKNPEIQKIFKNFQKLENRESADSMKRLGLNYEQNHGVMIADLLLLAKDYQGRGDIAKILRTYNVRESRILAEMIDNHNEMSAKELDEVVNTIDNFELVEQFAVNMKKDRDDLTEQAIRWAGGERLYSAQVGYKLLALSAQKLTEQEVKSLKETIINSPFIENMQLQKHMGACLRKVASVSPSYKKKIQDFILVMKKDQSKFAMVIEEIEPFMAYIA